jgi:hypothetical protein
MQTGFRGNRFIMAIYKLFMRTIQSQYYYNLYKLTIVACIYIILYELSTTSIGITSAFNTSTIATSSVNSVKDLLSSSPYKFLQPYKVLAQQTPFALNNNSNNNSNKDEAKIQKDSNTVIEASGEFANNQIKYGIVTWIQGGTWNLKISNPQKSDSSNSNITNKHNLTASFNANFTMIKPNGSFSHNHFINNFTSNDIIFLRNDIIVTGIANIHSDIGIEFKQVPITIHLFNKKVLGLTIDAIKSNEHFASPNAIFGTIIKGFGLDNYNANKTNITAPKQ